MIKSNTIINKYNGKDYMNATGEVGYGMMNDYIFRIVFQENKFALKGLLCSVLGLEEDQIVGLSITNEVKPGESIADKEYRMDIVVELNDDTKIDLEMQKDDYNNWQYRSLSYLCREFDSLHHGQDYSEVKNVYKIGFLNYTLFEDHPEFYAKYQMRNVRDGHVYTDRFNLIVVSLNQEKLATDEDRARGIDRWARLFRAKTWEELKMVASGNEYMISTLESVYLTNEDKNAIKIAREREDYLAMDAYRKKKIAELTNANKELVNDNKELVNDNMELVNENKELTETNKQLTSTVDELQKRIQELEAELKKK